jgi:hypothetical protein
VSTTTKRPIQFRITFLFVLTAMTGVALALIRRFHPILVLTGLAIPYAFLFEYSTTGFGSVSEASRRMRVARILAVVILAMFIGGVPLWQILVEGSPTVLEPLPLLSVTGAFLFRALTPVAAIPAAAFFLTNVLDVWYEREGIATRILFLLFCGTLADVYWLVTGWPRALKYQSLGYALDVTTVNVVFLLTLWLLVWTLRRSRRYWAKLAFAALFFLWCFACAFPWMGELP